MSDMFGFDAFSPSQIAQRVDQVGVIKARLLLLPLIMLGLLAGAFIGLGGMFFVLIKSDASLGFAMGQLLGGVAFCLGLLLVVVAGAELFTGNNLLVMAWADGLITSKELLRNWLVVCVANFAGAAGLAFIVYLSRHPEMNNGAVAATYLHIAMAKSELSFIAALFKGVLCNVLVCLAVWMAFAGRSVTDKAVAIVFPITAFVAAGFEHSVANMYFFPMAMLLQQDTDITGMAQMISWSSFFGNLVPVILGNIIGGGVLVALVYHLIYGRNMMPKKP
ncbi:MAG: formate transporter [Paraglaciecola sp.]|jgi:formate transporter